MPAPAAPAPPETALRTGSAGTTVASTARVALIGNPNTGKTTVFNRLCGARAKTSNFPGTTTALRTGALKLDHTQVEVLDLPGLYDLTLDIPEARIVRDVVHEARLRD